MSEKRTNFFSSNYFGLAVKNILIAFIIIVILVIAALIFSNRYTKHGKNETVPDLRGMSISEATNFSTQNNLNIEVIDSIYMRGFKLGTVIEQNPTANSIVKPGRKVYIIINSRAVRKISIPNVVDMSLRQAEALLSSIGLKISNIEYVASAYQDLVIGIKYNGEMLEQSTKLNDGSKIVIVAGRGGNSTNGDYGNGASVIGMSVPSAKETIGNSSYRLGTIFYDELPSGNEYEYIVYKEEIAMQDSIPEQVINLWASKNSSSTYQNSGKTNSTIDQIPLKNKKEKNKKEKNKDIEDFF